MIDPLKHKGLIITILKSYRCYADTFSNVDYEDLIQEAYLVILEKQEKYDPEIAAETTYFYRWIQDAMQRYIRKRSLFRRPIRYNQGLTLYDYVMPGVEIDKLPDTSIHHSPELELEGQEEAYVEMKRIIKKVESSRWNHRTILYNDCKDIISIQDD